jgi:hypothetical protein
MTMHKKLIPALACSAALVCLGALAACGDTSGGESDPAPVGETRAPDGTAAPGSNTPSDADGKGNPRGTSSPMATATPSVRPTIESTVVPNAVPSIVPTVTPPVDPTPEPDDIRAFEFSYEGVPSPVKAKIMRDGEVTIDSLPTELFPVFHVVESSGQSIDDNFCDVIVSRVERGALDAVRNIGGFAVRIDALPTAAKGFRYAALLKAIPIFNMAHFNTRLKLVSAKARIVLQEGALTPILGYVFELNKALNQLSVSTETTQMTGEISARDLICDLRSGKASIEFEVTTNKPDYRPTVRTVGFSGPL